MKILVTGGFGLIGHNVVQRLLLGGHDVLVVDNLTTYGIIPQDELNYLMDTRRAMIRAAAITAKRDYQISYTDISNFVELSSVFEQFVPELVIHLASFPRQKVVNANPALGSKVMSEGLINILELCKKHETRRIVYVSSSMVYGQFGDNATEDTPCNPEGQYGILKLAGEWLVRDYTRKYGIEHVILRPSAVYGPLDVEDRVISKFILSALRGQVLRVNGASEKLDFTYVTDAADGVTAAALSENTTNKTYNITKSHSRTLEYAASLAVSIVGTGTVAVRDRDPDFPSRGSLNIDAARRDFGFDPKVDVEEGFSIYHNWIVTSPYWSKRI